MLGNMYSYNPKKQTLVEAIHVEAIVFNKRFGYMPHTAEVRLDESQGIEVSFIELKPIKGMPPGHFMLYPAIVRLPVVYNGKRIFVSKTS